MRLKTCPQSATGIATQSHNVTHTCLPILTNDLIDFLAAGRNTGQMSRRFNVGFFDDPRHSIMCALARRAAGAKGHREEFRFEQRQFRGRRAQFLFPLRCIRREKLHAEISRQFGLCFHDCAGAAGLLHGLPRPRYGVFAPICSPGGAAFFGRDSSSTLPVWSARDGYPGDGVYREFHRDLGWDLPEEELLDHGISSRRPLGLKLHRVTAQGCPLDEKQPYDPAAAKAKTDDHAAAYLAGRARELESLAVSMERTPLLVAPFDAELFGHWWFEGPQFLAALFRQASASGVQLVTLREELSSGGPLQVCRPSPSSWGQGGYHDYWLNDTNAWVVAE